MSDVRWLTAEEQRMWRAFHAMRRVLDRGLDRQLAEEAGLSGADFEVLVATSEAPERQLRARDLVRVLHWDRSRLSHQLRRMENRGLVERRDCPGDARGTIITLTPAGWGLIQDAAPAHVATVRSYVFDELTPAEVTAFADLAERVADRVRRVSADACAGGSMAPGQADEAGSGCAAEADVSGHEAEAGPTSGCP